MAGILAVGEVIDGRVTAATHELTAAGKTLDQTLGEGVSVVLMGLGLSFLATLYPSWRAARLDPAEALRYE